MIKLQMSLKNLNIASIHENIHSKQSVQRTYMSRRMRKPTTCICENKSEHQLCCVVAQLISAFVFATRIVPFLCYLGIYLKFQASRMLFCDRPVCVGPGWKTILLAFLKMSADTFKEITLYIMKTRLCKSFFYSF